MKFSYFHNMCSIIILFILELRTIIGIVIIIIIDK